MSRPGNTINIVRACHESAVEGLAMIVAIPFGILILWFILNMVTSIVFLQCLDLLTLECVVLLLTKSMFDENFKWKFDRQLFQDTCIGAVLYSIIRLWLYAAGARFIWQNR